MPPNIFRLVKGPLIRGLGLKHNFFRVGAMPAQRNHRHQHGQDRHGQRYWRHAGIVLGMFCMFLQFIQLFRTHLPILLS